MGTIKRIRKKNISIVTEIAAFFVVGIAVTGVLAYIVLSQISSVNVMNQKIEQANSVTDDISGTLKGYASYEWLVTYWLNHSGELDLEYDSSDLTYGKLEVFHAKYPNIVFRATTAEEIEGLPPEDQKMFAEIVYNRLIVIYNQIKTDYKLTFLYTIAVDPEFQQITFLFTGSDGSRTRGTSPGNSYILGTKVPASKELSQAFADAVKDGRCAAETDVYLDSFTYMGMVDGMHIFSAMTDDLSDIRNEIRGRTRQGAASFLVLQIVLSGICLFLIIWFVIRPLQQVQGDMVLYRETKDAAYVRKKLSQIESHNEIGELAYSFSDLVDSVDTYIDEIAEITAERQRINTELSVATQIQANMLPRVFPPFPDRTEFDIFASTKPAKEVGGDFYDFFFTDEDHLALVVADVSGKSVPAALFMMTSKTLIKNRALIGGTPSEILYDVNNQLCEGNELEFFVTVWLAIVELSTGKVVESNAGHEHPMLRHKGGQFEAVIYRHSPAVASMEDIMFRQREYTLEPGDSMFVYTDGVAEATSTANELYGMERTLAVLNRDGDLPMENIIDAVSADIDNFTIGADQFDDITMLVFSYYGKKAG